MARLAMARARLKPSPYVSGVPESCHRYTIESLASPLHNQRGSQRHTGRRLVWDPRGTDRERPLSLPAAHRKVSRADWVLSREIFAKQNRSWINEG